MKDVFLGATGNGGVSVIESPAGDPAIESIVAGARGPGELPVPRTELVSADTAGDDLVTRHLDPARMREILTGVGSRE